VDQPGTDSSFPPKTTKCPAQDLIGIFRSGKLNHGRTGLGTEILYPLAMTVEAASPVLGMVAGTRVDIQQPFSGAKPQKTRLGRRLLKRIKDKANQDFVMATEEVPLFFSGYAEITKVTEEDNHAGWWCGVDQLA
jgi:hypothetical protein